VSRQLQLHPLILLSCEVVNFRVFIAAGQPRTNMGTTLSQMMPPKPTLTEANVLSQKGRVLIVTGGYSGVGLELVRILYHAGGKVYIAGRSQDKANAAIEEITGAAGDREGCGQLEFLELDLSDLSTIKPSAEAFKAKETRLDVLWNNAAVSSSPPELRTNQGHELQMGTNALGPYLFTELLLPLLQETAKSAPPASVRVVWTASLVVEGQAPRGALNMEHLKTIPTDRYLNYANSKTANVLMCTELGRQSTAKDEKVLHVVQNPGNLSTNLLRHMPRWVGWLISPILYDAKYGAYTELWAGLGEELTMSDQGQYIMPWGRKHPSLRKDILDACKTKEDGGTGISGAFREWADEQVKEYK